MQLFGKNGFFTNVTAAGLTALGIGGAVSPVQAQDEPSLTTQNAAATLDPLKENTSLQIDGFFLRWYQADINSSDTNIYAIDPGLFTNFTYGDFSLNTRLAWSQTFAPHADTHDMLGQVWLKGAKFNYQVSDNLSLNAGKYDETFGTSWMAFNAAPNIYGVENGLFNLRVDETIGFGAAVKTSVGTIEGRTFWADTVLNQRYSSEDGLSKRVTREDGGLANSDAPSFYLGYRGNEQSLNDTTKLNFGGDVMYRQPGENNHSGEWRIAAHERTDTKFSDKDSLRVYNEITFMGNHGSVAGAQQFYTTSSVEYSHSFNEHWSVRAGATAGFQFGDDQNGSHLSAELQGAYTSGKNTFTVGTGVKNESYRKVDPTTLGLIFSYTRSF